MHATWRPLHQPLGVVFVIALAASLAAGGFLASGLIELVGMGSDAVVGTWPTTMGFR